MRRALLIVAFAGLLLGVGAKPDPGRVTVHRLNRAEYNNTVRDLLGVDLRLADAFPLDDSGYGFDNIGDVLSSSPVLMEKYLTAAEKLSAAVLQPGSPSYSRVFRCGHQPGQHTIACSRTNLAELLRRAFRRPVTAVEVDRFLTLVPPGSIDDGFVTALQSVLVSPNFLFRIEHDRDPRDPLAVHKVDDFELASRLSYFLWSSMPDDQLLDLAAHRRLRKSSVLRAQIHRMLADAKSRGLVENFAGQWLQLRSVAEVHPDRDKFPRFDSALGLAMRQETELYFESIVREDRSVLELIDSNYTFLNERLAAFYGVPGVTGENLRRVELPADSHRGGLITQASVLLVSSYPTRTSPVLRGKWILDNLLNLPPPPPPPNIPNLDLKAVGSVRSLRQQLEQHRASAACRSCHSRMDPLGFGLENYDAVGQWRTLDGNFPIDSSGSLPDGTTFEGSDGLKQVLSRQKDVFLRCLAEKLLTYALGRGVEDYDKSSIDLMVRRTAQNGYKFSRLVEEIVSSPEFQKRRGDAGGPNDRL